jgi:hypothetical protein
MDVEDVSVMGSQPFSDRIVVRNAWRFVWGTTSNVQVTGPVTGVPGTAPVGSG